MIGNSVTCVNTVYKMLLSVYNNNQKQRHKEKIMKIALLNSLHDYYEGYLKAAMKGSNSYSFLLKDNSRDEAEELAAITGAGYHETEKGIELVTTITKEQREYIDDKLFIVSPYIVSLCNASAYDRMKHCIEDGESLPEWAYVILTDIIHSGKNTQKLRKIIEGIDLLRRQGHIKDPKDKLSGFL